MQYSSYLLEWLGLWLSIFLLFNIINPIPIAATTRMKLPPNVTVPAIFGFGDSIIDPGNNNNLNTLSKSNFPPYGKDFMGGIPTGRFSNGRIPTDFIAEMLSIKQSVGAYLDPSISPQDLLTGVSFASGGSGYDPLTSTISSVLSLSEQLEYLKEYKARVREMVGEERTEYIMKNSMFLVVAGSVDIAISYFDIPIRRNMYDVDGYASFLANSSSSFVQDLYELGARRIGVFSTLPIGCLPSQRTLAGGISRKCVENYNNLAQVFKSKLAIKLDSLSNSLRDAKLVYIDFYTTLLDMIQHPLNYGFEQVTRGCCGTGLIEVAESCNKFDTVCSDDTKYLFWDSYHPTERGYELLSTTLLNKYINGFF
ncbi:GDSL esterase/lipase EXL3-like isoform X1 [Silene latifolia]|uniref:GDSL esterase/lipase EXL3-like isoform X1 n=1 Tax=Silene latifolia TaxID=37657 RepID=UPI003D77F419